MNSKTFILLIVAFLSLFSSLILATQTNSNYNKIFHGETWIKGEAFTDWAIELRIVEKFIEECSTAVKSQVEKETSNIIDCLQLAKFEDDKNLEQSLIVWVFARDPLTNVKHWDCRHGLVVVNSSSVISELSPVNCNYVLEGYSEAEERASYPKVVFKVLSSGEIGIVFDGHGNECGGKAVLLQNKSVFEWIHRLHWDCYR